MNDFQDDEFDLELDKLNLSSADPTTIPTPEESPEAPIEEQVPEEKSQGKMIVAVSALALVVVLLFLWQQTIRRSEPPEENEVVQPYDFLQIGPIYTNLDKSRYISVSLRLKYYAELKTQISALDSKFKNDILTFLHSEETKKIAQKNDLDALASYVKEGITQLLKRDYIAEIIFSELRVY